MKRQKSYTSPTKFVEGHSELEIEWILRFFQRGNTGITLTAEGRDF